MSVARIFLSHDDFLLLKELMRQTEKKRYPSKLFYQVKSLKNISNSKQKDAIGMKNTEYFW